MADSFAHLHVHTEYSMLDGAAKNTKLFTEVARQGMPAVAMSDHGNMFGAYEFYQTSTKHEGVKPIIGIEAYVAPESRHFKKPVFWSPGGKRPASDGEGGKDVSGGGRYTHMTMWAETERGLRNLFKLSSLASYEGYYGKPRMDRELLAAHAGGIIATTGCPSGEVQTRLRLGQYDQAVEAAGTYRDIFGKDNYFLELMDHGIDIERQVRGDLLKLARQLDIPLLATNDSHYVTEDQAEAHDSLLCIGTGKNKADTNRLKFSGAGYYIKTAEQMRALFAELPEACDNTLRIAERVQSYEPVFAFVDQMPQFEVPDGYTQESWLREEITKGLARRYPHGASRQVLDQVETEMKIIGPMGFSAYFLIVADICRHARDNDVPLGPGRGSAPGSIVAYLTGITAIDPLEHNLLFERFLNPERISPPDVDLDFGDRWRDEMIRYVTDKYGAGRTSQVTTFGMIKAKNAIKDSSRIMGYPYAMGERITKAMPPPVGGKEINLTAVVDKSDPRYGESGEIRGLYENEPDVRTVIDTARGVEGLMRGTGVHACALIISKTEMTELVPMHRRDSDGVIIAGFDYPSLEAMGLLKMDFLGLRNLTVISDTIKIAKANRGVELSTETIPLDDQATYQLLGRGDTLGIFQLDGGGMRTLLRQMAPTSFDDVSAAIALYRPGPMAANAHTNYALRKNNRQPVTPIHPELKDALDPILGWTHHLLIYQEQIMAAARALAGYSLGGADLLRRAMGKKKKEILDAEWDTFHAGMRGNGYSDEATQALWDVMLPFSGYAFNQSHSAGYGRLAYWTAYLKANYPAEYTAALLTSVGDDKDKMALYLADARAAGVNVLSPEINESVSDFTAVGEDVRFGLTAIRNVGANVVESVVSTRRSKGKYTSFQDFLAKSEITACNKRVIDSLIKAGAFDNLGHPRRALSEVHEQAVDAALPVKRQEAHGQFDLFLEADNTTGANQDTDFDISVGDQQWPTKQQLALERDMLGLYVSAHPLDGAEHILARNRDVSVAELLGSGRTEGDVRLAGLISAVQPKMTKQGNPWAIVTLEDRDGSVEVLYFPKNYQLLAHELVTDNVIATRGQLKARDDGSLSVFGQELTVLDVSSAGRGGPDPVTISLPESKIRTAVVEELKRILLAHPGQTPVRLRVDGHRSSRLFELGFLVDPENGFASDIKGSLGTSAWLGKT